MDGYADGDTANFDVVYDRLSAPLYLFALKQTRCTATAEDVVQETFLRMHQARAKFLRGAPVFPWARAIARRIIIDDARHRGHVNAAAALGRTERREDETPDKILEAKQTSHRLSRELSRLPLTQRDTFELVRGSALSTSQTASLLGTTANSVKIRVHRVCDRLRAVLREQVLP
jgi:RNA polymerase sigma-70 factor (ECF subfamily)